MRTITVDIIREVDKKYGELRKSGKSFTPQTHDVFGNPLPPMPDILSLIKKMSGGNIRPKSTR